MNPYESPETDDRVEKLPLLPGWPEGFGEWCGASIGIAALVLFPYFVWAAIYIAWNHWRASQ